MTSLLSDDHSSSDEESFELIDDFSPAGNKMIPGNEELVTITKAAAVNELQKEWNEIIEDVNRIYIEEKAELEDRIAALGKELDEEKKKFRKWLEQTKHTNMEKCRAFADLNGELTKMKKTIEELTAENDEKTMEILRLKTMIKATKENAKGKEYNQNEDIKNNLIGLDGKMEELFIDKSKLFKKPSHSLILDLQHNTDGIEIATEVKEHIIPENVANPEGPTRTVKINRGIDRKIGIQTLMNSIYNVFVDSPAHLGGVRRGDEIVAIDGVKVSTLTSEKKIDELLDNGSASITFELQHNPELLEELISRNEATNNLEERPTRTVTITRGDNGMFGIGWSGSTVYTVHDGSPAHKNGVKRGDQIISIDGVEVEMLTKEEIDLLFQSASESITFVLQHNSERIQKYTAAKTKMSEMGLEVEQISNRTVILCPGEDGLFGLSHIGTSISIVNENSPASNEGVKRGDQIVSINGANVEMESEDEISGMFEKAREMRKISMVLRHNPERLIDLERAWNHRK